MLSLFLKVFTVTVETISSRNVLLLRRFFVQQVVWQEYEPIWDGDCKTPCRYLWECLVQWLDCTSTSEFYVSMRIPWRYLYFRLMKHNASSLSWFATKKLRYLICILGTLSRMLMFFLDTKAPQLISILQQ